MLILILRGKEWKGGKKYASSQKKISTLIQGDIAGRKKSTFILKTVQDISQNDGWNTAERKLRRVTSLWLSVDIPSPWLSIIHSDEFEGF